MLCHLRLDGGAAEDEGISSSGSLERLRPVEPITPRFAADILGRSGELWRVSFYLRKVGGISRLPIRRMGSEGLPHTNSNYFNDTTDMLDSTPNLQNRQRLRNVVFVKVYAPRGWR